MVAFILQKPSGFDGKIGFHSAPILCTGQALDLQGAGRGIIHDSLHPSKLAVMRPLWRPRLDYLPFVAPPGSSASHPAFYEDAGGAVGAPRVCAIAPAIVVSPVIPPNCIVSTAVLGTTTMVALFRFRPS